MIWYPWSKRCVCVCVCRRSWGAGFSWWSRGKTKILAVPSSVSPASIPTNNSHLICNTCIHFFLNRKSRIDELQGAGVQVPWGAEGRRRLVCDGIFKKIRSKGARGRGLQGHRDFWKALKQRRWGIKGAEDSDWAHNYRPYSEVLIVRGLKWEDYDLST